MPSNYIENVAIVGATGNVGSHITRALLATGKHTITAITRADSKSQPPSECRVAKVDYSDEPSLVDALRGQDALVITLGIQAGSETQEKLIRAAGEAGVAWIMPNEWASDVTSEAVREDVQAFAELHRIREYIRKIGKSSYVGLSNGFWYEFSLAIPDAYGFDIAKKEATFFDDGMTKICTSTWPQVGRATAAILSLPVSSASGPCLDKFRDQNVFVKSFVLSQRDMLQSLLRVTGDKESDWKITKVPAQQRVAEAQEAVKAGNQQAYVQIMYTRIFYNDGNGDFEKLGKLSNEELGLPTEDLDEATRVAVERSKKPMW